MNALLTRNRAYCLSFDSSHTFVVDKDVKNDNFHDVFVVHAHKSFPFRRATACDGILTIKTNAGTAGSLFIGPDNKFFTRNRIAIAVTCAYYNADTAWHNRS